MNLATTEIATIEPVMKPIAAAAVLSMLHEPADRNSATRRFRNKPVLAWTLDRLGRANRLNRVVVLCWDDQSANVAPVANERNAFVLAKGPRVVLPNVEAVAVSRAWADGWRGGLLATCDFDLGFYAPWTAEILNTFTADAAVLVDPAAGLIDPVLVDRLVEQAEKRGHVELHFSQGAPGLCGTLIRRGAVERFATTRTHTGAALTYLPDHAVKDPISGEGCLPLPTTLTRSTRQYKLGSDRQINRLTSAAASLNGSLAGCEAEELAQRLDWSSESDALPRDVTLELTTRRDTRPIYWAGRHLTIDRPDLSLEAAEALFAEIANVDDIRLTLGGVGDAMLHPQFFEIIALAKKFGVRSIHLETDLLSADGSAAIRLATSGVDVISVFVPALTPATYQTVMGVDGYSKVLANITALARARGANGRLTPLIAPTFVKCKENLAELEPWYDQWLKAIGSAVVTGPSDCAGQVPDMSLADMSPPRRSACVRLASRCTILSNGSVVSCEQDVLGLTPLGTIGVHSLADVWARQFRPLQLAQARGEWSEHSLCAGCREWHRP